MADGLERLCSAKEVVVSTGSGGVGKTTTAAALAATAALHLDAKVLVLTVDPAKRLASALGLAEFGNVETQVAPEAFTDVGRRPEGELWAAMLDTKQSWDDLVTQHAPDASTRDAILANPLYQNITVLIFFLPLAWPLLPSVRPVDWLWLAMLGIFCTGLAHSLFVASLRVLKARTTAVIFALEPVYGILFAWWLFSEQPTLRMLAGGLLIVSAIFVSARMARGS